MKYLLIFLIFCIVVFLLSIISLNIDYAALKKKFIERNVNDLLDRASHRRHHGRIGSYIDQLIMKSNIKFVFASYSVLFHLFLSTLTFLMFYFSNFISSHFIIKLTFGIIGFFVPFVALKLIGYVMERRVRKQSVVYMTGVRNYNRTLNDIFKAFEMIIESAPEPLRSYTESMVLKHKAKISQAKCLNDFQANVGQNTELGLLIDNLKLAIYEGADVNRLIEEYINDMEKLYEIEDEFVAEEITSSVAIYMLIAIVIIGTKLIYSFSTTGIINELWHQMTVAFSLFVSLWIIIITLRR